MAEELSADRKFDLETRRIEADLEIRRAELEEKRAQREIDANRYGRDAELKRLELTLAAGRGVRFTTAQATVAAAVLALVSGAIGGVVQAWLTRDIEASKSSALIETERLKANANIALEKQKQESAERLDRAKFETTLILKATESPNRDEQIRNLKFFLKAGFINDPGDKIARMDESELPSSPPPMTSRTASLPSIDALSASSPIRRLARPIGLLARADTAATKRDGGPDGHCTGWLIDAMHVLTADYCIASINPRLLTIRLGYVSPSETGDVYRMTELAENNDKVGYAILKVDPAAGAKYGWFPVLVRPAQRSEDLMIVQHAGKEQRWTDQNCTVLQPSAELPDKTGAIAFLHTCRSEPGSGGAPVVAKRDNAVLGIVHSSSVENNELAVSMTAIVESSTIVRQLSAAVAK
jgi:hypothetical protein